MLDAEGASLRRIAAATGVSTATVRVALGRVSPRRAYCAEQDPAEQDAAGETADDPVEDPDLGPAEIDTGVRGAVPTPAGQGRTPGTPQPRRPARGQQGSGRTGAYVLKVLTTGPSPRYPILLLRTYRVNGASRPADLARSTIDPARTSQIRQLSGRLPPLATVARRGHERGHKGFQVLRRPHWQRGVREIRNLVDQLSQYEWCRQLRQW